MIYSKKSSKKEITQKSYDTKNLQQYFFNCIQSEVFELQPFFLASQDALEVMYVSQSVTQSADRDFTDLTLVSDDTNCFTWFTCFTWFNCFTCFTRFTWFTYFTLFTCFTWFACFTWFTCFMKIVKEIKNDQKSENCSKKWKLSKKWK